ncbi:MAG: restriction endonuclease subunit S [Syntrophales bacterium]
MNKPVNKIDKLIAELCAEGVEFKELGEIAQYSRQRIAAADLNNENYVGVDNLLPNKQGKTKSNYVPTTGNLTRFESGDVLLGNIRPYLKKIWRATHTGGTNGDVLAIQINNKEMLQSEFLYYLLSSDDFFNFDMKFAKGAKMPRGNKSEILKFPIPIPTPAIQQEIVRILDTFTTLEAELEAELEARKKQYGYYREELLTFGDDVKWKTLGAVGKLLRGTAITAKETTDGEIPVVANAPKPIYFHSESNRSGETIVVARSGAYAGLVSFWSQPIFLTDAFSVFPDAAMLKAKFVYYLLKQKQETIHSMKKGSGVPHVRVKDFESYPIPIPPLADQERIVAILDKFDALVNDISAGLPAELNARHKQYEYYRNKLLTFKPLENEYAKQ